MRRTDPPNVATARACRLLRKMQGAKGAVPQVAPALGDKRSMHFDLDSRYMPLNLNYPGLRQVHEKPPIFLCDDFLTEEECDQLISVASPLLQRSKTHAIAGALLPVYKQSVLANSPFPPCHSPNI